MRFYTGLAVAGLMTACAGRVGAAEIRRGDILVADLASGPSQHGAIIRVDPATGAQTVISQAGSFVEPDSVTLGPGGSLYVADYAAFGDGAIFRVDPATGAQTVLSSGGLLQRPVGLVLGPDGFLYVGNSQNLDFTNSVLRIDPATGAQSVVTPNGELHVPTDLLFDPAGTLYVTAGQIGPDGGAVHRVNIATGEQHVVAAGTPFRFLSGLGREADGSLIVGDLKSGEPGRLYRVDPQTGTPTLLSQGGGLLYPAQVEVDALGNILVTEANPTQARVGTLLRIDPRTGAQTVLSSGGNFLDPWGLYVVVPEPHIAWVVASTAGLLARRRRPLTA